MSVKQLLTGMLLGAILIFGSTALAMTQTADSQTATIVVQDSSTNQTNQYDLPGALDYEVYTKIAPASETGPGSAGMSDKDVIKNTWTGSSFDMVSRVEGTNGYLVCSVEAIKKPNQNIQLVPVEGLKQIRTFKTCEFTQTGNQIHINVVNYSD